MNREGIRSAVEQHLDRLGVSRSSYLWQPLTAELLIVVGDSFRTIKLKSGISRRGLMFELGRVTGWLERAPTSASTARSAPAAP